MMKSKAFQVVFLFAVGTSFAAQGQKDNTVVLAGMMPTWLQVFLTDRFEFKNLEAISPADMSYPVLKYKMTFRDRFGERIISSQSSSTWRSLASLARGDGPSTHLSAPQSSTPVKLIIWPNLSNRVLVYCPENSPCLMSFPMLNRALNAELRASSHHWPLSMQYWFDMEKGKLVSAGDFPFGVHSRTFDYRRIGDLVEASLIDRGQAFRFQLFHGPADAKINLNE